MNTRKDDGPAANDGDEMWGNVKNISFDLTNDEVNVINARNSKFLFTDKLNPENIHATCLQSRISVAFCFSIRFYSRVMKQIFRIVRNRSLHQVLSQSCWIRLVMECDADNVRVSQVPNVSATQTLIPEKVTNFSLQPSIKCILQYSTAHKYRATYSPVASKNKNAKVITWDT